MTWPTAPSTSARGAAFRCRRGWPSFTNAQKQRIGAFIWEHREEAVAEGKHPVQVTTAADHFEDLVIAWELASAAERQRFLRIDVHADPAKLRAQIRSAISKCPPAAISGWRAEHDVLGQVFVDRAEPVANPRSQSGMIQLPRMPSGLPR